MFAQLINTLKKSPKTIVFTEGTDPRILEASARLLSGNFLKPVLVGNPDEIAAAAEDIGFNIRGAEIIDPENYDGMDEMVDKMVELRKGKMTADECRAALEQGLEALVGRLAHDRPGALRTCRLCERGACTDGAPCPLAHTVPAPTP